MAKDAARELPRLSLDEALQLVHLYAERGSPKYEQAGPAMARAVPDAEREPRLTHFAELTMSLAQRQRDE
jgi:hypothetical protein